MKAVKQAMVTVLAVEVAGNQGAFGERAREFVRHGRFRCLVLQLLFARLPPVIASAVVFRSVFRPSSAR